MIKLLKANLYRMFKSYSLYIFIAIAILLCLGNVFISSTEGGCFKTVFLHDVAAMYMNNSVIKTDYSFEIMGLTNLIIEDGIVLMALSSFYIAIFAGKNFSEGAIRNTLIAGHKKSSVYLAALITSIISTVIIALAIFISTAVYMLLAGLKPIIWWPYVIIMILVICLLSLVVSSVTLLLVFSTRKTYIAIIAIIILAGAISLCSMGFVMDDELNNHIYSMDLYKDEEIYTIDFNLVTSSFNDEEYKQVIKYCGKDLTAHHKFSDLSAKSKAKIYIIKCVPLSFFMEFFSYDLNPYTLVASKAATRYAVSGVIWIILSTAGGILIFRKKDII